MLSSSYVHIQYSIYCKKWFQKMNPPLLSSSNSRYCKTSASSALPFQSGKYEDCHEQSTLLYFMTRQILIIIFAPGACIGGPVSVHFFHHASTSTLDIQVLNCGPCCLTSVILRELVFPTFVNCRLCF